MKKLVIFTLAMVFALAIPMMAVADQADDGSAAANFGGVAVAVDDIDVQGNAIAKGNAATNGAEIDNSKSIDIDVDKDVNVNKAGGDLALQGGEIDKRSNYNNDYIVDNAILANVNVAGLANQPFLDQNGRITFIKTQKAEVNGSFNFAQGVSNVNSAAGNMNNQAASTSIGVAFVK